jgi:hypothetical protein
MANYLFDFGLKPSKKVVLKSAKSFTFSTSQEILTESKGGILFIEVSKDLDWYGELTHRMNMEDFADVLIIIAGDQSDTDFVMERKPEIKTLFRHIFDFASWEERDCVDLFERHARREGFLIGEGVRERVADGCCKCRTHHSCDQGHDVNMLWELVKCHRALRVYEIPETTRTIQCDDMEVDDSML